MLKQYVTEIINSMDSNIKSQLLLHGMFVVIYLEDLS